MLPRFLNSTRTFITPLAAAFVFAAALPTQAQEWAVDKSASKITFEAEAGGQAVTGEFQQFQAEIRFDPDYPEHAEIAASIDMNTVSSGQPQVDSALLGKDWFDTQTYPRAGFQAKAVKAGDQDGHYVMEGTLTMKGNSEAISLPFTLAVDQGEARVKGETSIKRLEYGIGPSGPVSGMAIGDMVKIKLDIAATRLDN
jgi:polyisoprenoid-binding protein YceI